MELPPLSNDQLAKLTASNIPPTQLFEILSKYETEVSLISAGTGQPETGSTDPELLSLFYCSFFFAHLITDQIQEARALLQRIPEPLRQQDASLKNCHSLLQSIWQTKYSSVYRILQTLPWAEAVQPLVLRYESSFQNQTLIKVSTSYQAIRPAVAATYLGLDAQAAENGDTSIIQKFTDCGWKWDSETQLLHPTPISVPPTDQVSFNSIRETMSMLSNWTS
ncbi:hypothetical protein N7495_002905 [Penicillium taxi]|uniref:uncharacterized protein n=1 Tax=Penicillium taxi TaxID=168475 RepID=UPI002544DC9A|nr:uncharacterized protein N7495_002905 [Penicillium taxi]KAJ5902377.1 hypothetical protein N7495_002905 [Penicillium taxi]